VEINLIMAQEETVQKEVEVPSKSLEDALKTCKVDLDVWEIDRYAVEENTKGFNYKINFKRKSPLVWNIEDLKKELAEYAKSPVKVQHKFKEENLLMEFAPFDLHWGKLAWDEEAGENYDMDLAAEALNKSVDYTIEMASKFPVTKIVFPFGQDFFQIDNEQGTTTAGTQQDTDSRFKKIFKEGRRIVIETIEKLKQFAPVDVLVVSGNHGKISEFMLGELLYIKYQNDKHVNVDNGAMDRKYYVYGKNLIMYTHGDQEKNSDLPLIMAAEMPKEWADCPSRYIKLGHFHQEMLREYCGVKVEILPSLSATDAWHKRKGYVNNTRGVISSLYDKNLGLVNKIYFNL
jgi:hypothetical protein